MLCEWRWRWNIQRLHLSGLSVAVDIFTLVCISVERYIAICHPLLILKLQSLRFADLFNGLILFFIWTCALLIALPNIFMYNLCSLPKRERFKCEKVHPLQFDERVYMVIIDGTELLIARQGRWWYFILALYFVIPILVMLVLYTLIIRRMYRNNTASTMRTVHREFKLNNCIDALPLLLFSKIRVAVNLCRVRQAHRWFDGKEHDPTITRMICREREASIDGAVKSPSMAPRIIDIRQLIHCRVKHRRRSERCQAVGSIWIILERVAIEVACRPQQHLECIEWTVIVAKRWNSWLWSFLTSSSAGHPSFSITRLERSKRSSIARCQRYSSIWFFCSHLHQHCVIHSPIISCRKDIEPFSSLICPRVLAIAQVDNDTSDRRIKKPCKSSTLYVYINSRIPSNIKTRTHRPSCLVLQSTLNPRHPHEFSSLSFVFFFFV